MELPAIELEERIKHELEENPALEEGKESLDDLENEKIESSNEEGEPVLTVGAETETGTEQPSGGILKFVILFALMIGISLLRPFLMQRSLRRNYYDERVWGLDKRRKL